MADDLISRQDAIDLIHKTIYGFFDIVDNESEEPMSEKDKFLLEVNKAVSNRTKELPSALRWIPVSERLPKLGEKVLVSTKNTVFTQVFKCIYGTPDRWGWEHNSIKKVTAWMPLPEPYKEKRREE